MSPWLNSSLFASFINAHPGFFSSRPSVPSSSFTDDLTLSSAIDRLQRLSFQLSNNFTLTGSLNQVLDIAQTVKSSSATMQCEAIFTKLQPMRLWLFWMPVTLLSTDSIKASDLVLLAQLYTVALAVDISLPELRGAALGSLTARRIEEIDHRLGYDLMSQPRAAVDLGLAGVEEAMQFPRILAARYMSSVSSQLQQQRQGQSSSYGVQQSSIISAPGTSLGFPAGFGSAFPTYLNRSTEDLSAPASPFLHYHTPASRRHSQLIEASPSLREESPFESGSTRCYSYHGDSPIYSSSFPEDELSSTFRRHSPTSYKREFVAPVMWA